MTTVYTRPILKSLMQGSRIAFIRQMRHMTQEELGQAIGLRGDNTRRLICRHEKHNRSPKEPKLTLMAEAMRVNKNLIKEYDFKSPEDLYYVLLWTEELFKDFTITGSKLPFDSNDTQRCLAKRCKEWKKMQRKYRSNEISYEEYWDWKMRQGDADYE